MPASHADLVELVEKVKPGVARIPKLTTFEITTALGLLYFAEQRADVAIVEVGLGGRLDATNVVAPKVSVITSLSYDHMAVLGDTLAKIAVEKAGIIKEGVPVISAPQKDEALDVLRRIAGERNAPLTVVGTDITFESLAHSLQGQSLRVAAGQRTLNATIPLLGSHQVQNAATAVAALWAMESQGLEVPDMAIQKGFADVKWPGRFEIARAEPPVIFDSAHNQDSFARLGQALEDYFPGRQVYLVFGASEDKNLPGMLDEIRGKVRRLFITRADHPRALPPEDIAALALSRGISHEVRTPVRAAFERALELAEKDGSIVLSAGSMFVTAEAIAAWQARKTADARNQT